MTNAIALKRIRRRTPDDPGAGALIYFSLIAASGFAVGWFSQALGF